MARFGRARRFARRMRIFRPFRGAYARMRRPYGLPRRAARRAKEGARGILTFLSKTIVSFKLFKGFQFKITMGFAIGAALSLGLLAFLPANITELIQKVALACLVIPISGPDVNALAQISLGIMFTQLLSTTFLPTAGVGGVLTNAVDAVKGWFH